MLKFRVFDIKSSLSFFKLFLVSDSPIFDIFGVKAPILLKSELSSFNLDLSEFIVVSSAFLFLDFFFISLSNISLLLYELSRLKLLFLNNGFNR